MSWKRLHRRFRRFLTQIPLQEYAPLREIKTVEQDLPRTLNPLPLIYELYWTDNPSRKPPLSKYDEFFQRWWDNNLQAIHDFIRSYFYGCCSQFAEEGFRARLFRIWTSLLTQFDFAYLWNAMFSQHAPLEASAEMDMAGLDARVKVQNTYVGIQVKKISYRREASQRRFASRTRKKWQIHFLVEIPYGVDDPSELQSRIQKARTPQTRKKYQKLYNWITRFLERLPNGFVVFREAYLNWVYQSMMENLKNNKPQDLPWNHFLDMA